MKTKSFTLIELLVVIVIIGILAGVIIVSTSSSINKANFAKAQAFSNTVQQELLLNLVSEWTFNSPAVSGKTEDSWGNNDGTVYGGATYKTKADGVCVYGGCYEFNGTDGYIGFNESVSLTYNNFTISWWMKRFETDYECIFSQLIGTSYGMIEVDSEVNEIRFESFTNNVFQPKMTTNLDLADGKWHHFTIISSSTSFKLYSDGIKTYTTTPNTDIANQVFNYIGAQQLQGTYIYGDYLEGFIDDIRMYNSSLTYSQIKQQYVAGLDSLLSNGNISKEEYDQRLNNLAQK